MVRVLLAVLAFSVSVSAQTTRPRALTPEELKTLHREAFELMRAGDLAKAEEKLEKVYAAIPQAQQSRGLVINHAVLDVSQGKFIMRGIRDLTTYLRQHRADDELMTNVLGIALNLAANNPKIKNAPIWQAGFKEWDRRNYVLDHGRPGWRRWGTRWITDAEYAKIEADQAQVKQDIEVQTDVVSRAAWRLGSLAEQQRVAGENQWRYDVLRQVKNSVAQDPTLSPWERNNAAYTADKLGADQFDAWLSGNQITGELAVAARELNVAQAKLRSLQAKSIRPSWPRTLAPVDPEIGPPEKLPAATQAAGATTAPVIRQDVSPDDLYGPPVNKR